MFLIAGSYFLYQERGGVLNCGELFSIPGKG